MVEVFFLYAVYVLFFSFFNSSEENVILGRCYESFFSRCETYVINHFGCLIPYSLVYTQILKEHSWTKAASVLIEVVVYVVVKDSLVLYIKGLNIFLSHSAKLPLNPSGHTFMFLNGIFVLVPVLFRSIKRKSLLVFPTFLIIYEYNRMICNTAMYYHTFYDVLLGVILFCLFRGVVYPVRQVYEESSYKNEWSTRGYLLFGISLFLILFSNHFFLWAKEGAQSSLVT